MKHKSVAGLSLLLVGCSTIQPLGPDVYRIQAGTNVVAQQAEEVCAKTGKKVLVKNIISVNSFIFQCLDPNSPDYKPPQYEQAPNAVIRLK